MNTPVYLTAQTDPSNRSLLYENFYRMVVNSATTTEALEKRKSITQALNAFRWEKLVCITSLFCFVIAILMSSPFLYAITVIPFGISFKFWLEKDHKITFHNFDLNTEKGELGLIYSTIAGRFDHMRECREFWVVRELQKQNLTVGNDAQMKIELSIANKPEIILWNKMAEKILSLPLQDVVGRAKLQRACTSFLSKDADRYVEIRNGRYYSRFLNSQNQESEISPIASDEKFPKSLLEITKRIESVWKA